MWDVVVGQQIGEALKGHSGCVNSVMFSPDGTHIASGSDDKTIRVWDVVTGQQINKALRGHRDLVHSVAFHQMEHILYQGLLTRQSGCGI